MIECGYYHFRTRLNMIINSNLSKFLLERLSYEQENIPQLTDKTIIEYCKEMIKLYFEESRLIRLTNKGTPTIEQQIINDLRAFFDKNFDLDILKLKLSALTQNSSHIVNEFKNQTDKFQSYINVVKQTKVQFSDKIFKEVVKYCDELIMRLMTYIIRLNIEYISNPSIYGMMTNSNMDIVLEKLLDDQNKIMDLGLNRRLCIVEGNLGPLLKDAVRLIITNYITRINDVITQNQVNSAKTMIEFMTKIAPLFKKVIFVDEKLIFQKFVFKILHLKIFRISNHPEANDVIYLYDLKKHLEKVLELKPRVKVLYVALVDKLFETETTNNFDLEINYVISC
jgi:hypothetical protein